jgi:hypothetical protein
MCELACTDFRLSRWLIKVKLPLCSIEHHVMKAYGGVGGVAPPFLTSALDRGERSASRPCSFIPEERASGTHWIGGWVARRAGNRTSAFQPVARRYTD